MQFLRDNAISDKWLNILITKDETKVKIFINGELDKEISFNLSLSNTSNNIYLGGAENSNDDLEVNLEKFQESLEWIIWKTG